MTTKKGQVVNGVKVTMKEEKQGTRLSQKQKGLQADACSPSEP
jgi:hypothetical protein